MTDNKGAGADAELTAQGRAPLGTEAEPLAVNAVFDDDGFFGVRRGEFPERRVLRAGAVNVNMPPLRKRREKAEQSVRKGICLSRRVRMDDHLRGARSVCGGSQQGESRDAAGVDMHHIVAVRLEVIPDGTVDMVGEARGVQRRVQLGQPSALFVNDAAEIVVLAVLRHQAIKCRVLRVEVPQAVEHKQLLSAVADQSAEKLQYFHRSLPQIFRCLPVSLRAVSKSTRLDWNIA